MVVAKPIDLILTLENEDAVKFWDNMENPPEPSKEEIELCKEAIELYKDQPFLKISHLI